MDGATPAKSRQARHAKDNYLTATMDRRAGEQLTAYCNENGIKRLWAITDAVTKWLKEKGAQ